LFYELYKADNHFARHLCFFITCIINIVTIVEPPVLVILGLLSDRKQYIILHFYHIVGADRQTDFFKYISTVSLIAAGHIIGG